MAEVENGDRGLGPGRRPAGGMGRASEPMEAAG